MRKELAKKIIKARKEVEKLLGKKKERELFLNAFVLPEKHQKPPEWDYSKE